MKSIKTLLLLLGATLAVRAPAEYLLWSIDWEDVDPSADYAAIVVLDQNGENIGTGSSPYTYLLLADAPTTGETFIYKGSYSPVEVTSDITDYANSNYSFALYLYDKSDSLVSKSNAESYASLSDSIWKSDLNPGVSTVWSPTTYAVPEPATGTLFIAGALLLFRRKRS